MRLLITGGRGLLAREIRKQAGSTHVVETPGREALDVTDRLALREAALAFRPDVLVHAAALTNVDACERDPREAYRVNGAGTRNAALAAETAGAALVYISTDFVFDGENAEPYHEMDTTKPINVYGGSKLAGEDATRTHCRRHFILRTAWLYGSGGKNFLSRLPALLREKGDLQVVQDSCGSPTYAPDLARAVLDLAATDAFGTYHVVNPGALSWLDIASRMQDRLGSQARLHPVTFAELALPARRPQRTPLQTILDGPRLRSAEEAIDAFCLAQEASHQE